MRVRRLPAVLAVASVLAVAAMGCGGNGGGDGNSSSGKSANTWASEVCGALGDWVQEIQASSNALSDELRTTRDLKTVKSKFVAFLEEAAQSTSRMAARFREIGPPDIADGEAIQRELTDAFEDARTSFTRALERARQLSTKDLDSFSKGVGELSTDVQRQLGAAGNRFNELDTKYDDDELTKAVSDEPACEQFSAPT